jgi:hypothetical protein
MKAEHVLVAGPSGGGKTTYLRELHARHDGPSIFLTSKSGERKAHDRPPKRVRKSSAAYPEDIEQSRQWGRERSETVQIIVDECQNAPTFTSGKGPLKEGLHEDRSSGVKWVVATQSPGDLRTSQNGYAPVQQAKHWVWVGPLKTWHTGFMNANGMSDMKPLLPSENFAYAVLDPTQSLSPKERIVHRGETNAEFG